MTRPAHTRSHSAPTVSASPGAGSPASTSAEPARSASWRKNSAPPPPAPIPSVLISARCSGESGGSGSTSGSSRSATSVGARASHPSPPARPPHPVHVTSPEAVSSSSRAGEYPGSRAGSTKVSRALAGSGAPASCSMTPSRSSGLGTLRSRLPGPAPMPCHAGRKRPSAAGSTGSTSARSLASEARRTRRSTSASQYSVVAPSGRSSPRTTRPLLVIRSSTPVTTATPRPSRVASCAGGKGPCVRA